MVFEQTPLKDLILVKPTVFEDERGYFYESYNKRNFSQNGIDAEFVQDNQSLSHKDVLRGLHFQKPPFAQGKLIRVVQGSVLDVAVDLRKDSSTYGKSYAVELSDRNKWMFWIPEGFAHGFLTLQDHTVFQYKCTNFYNKNAEGGIYWNDPALGIDWGITHPLLSEKDLVLPLLKDFITVF